MKKKIMAVFAIIMSLCMTGCSIPEFCHTAGIGDIVEIADESIPSSSGDAAILAGESGITVEDIKAKYGDNNTDIAPFYNISQNTSFIFHFESQVEPACAVTVHTDDSCNMDSMVYQINEGYVSKDKKTDVVVKPGSPVMNIKNKNKNYIWGYAPIYYLCIRYDLKSAETKKLDKPVIVPFTVKSDVSVPNIMPYINEKGQFEIKWNPVDSAVKYNIYESTYIDRLSDASSLSRPECAYMGDNLKLVTSVDADTNVFNDFHLDGNGNTACSGSYVAGQNFYRLGTYYVTAVDKDGKESFFSMAAESIKYSRSLPKAFEDQSVFEKKDGIATVLPGMVSIKMCDGKTARFPASYKKIKEEDGCCVYQYTIHGTLLTGEIKYKNETGVYAECVNSPYQFSSAMYDFKNEINPVPRNIVKSKNTSQYVDAVKEDPEYDRQWTHIVYGEDECYARAGIENERIKNDGVYPDGKSPVAALTGNDVIFNNGQNNTEDDEKHNDKDVKQKEDNHKNDNKTEEDVYKYKIFADSAEEEYLALCIMDGQEEINIQSFPELQNTEYLTDVLYKVIYQNPYIIGIKSFAYDATNMRLHITYSKDKKEIKRQQEEIKVKANEIIKSYIKDDMGEEDRVMAIWTYLENNTVYDDEACAAALGNGFSGTGGYDDSFTAYGVLCKGKGVCQSYMYAMKLLCETAGIECKSLTGYLHNTTPHGWNAVKIDGDWCWIDATNTKQNSGVPYFIYQTSSEFAENSWNYVLDKNYELDDNLGFAITDNMAHDWYVERGLYAESYDDIVKIVKEKVKEYNGTLYIKCSFAPDIYKEKFSNNIVNALSEAGYSASEVNYSSLSSVGQIVMIDLSKNIN